MMKKIYRRLAIAVLLVLTLASMFGTVIQAATADYYELTIDYEATQCSVDVKVDGKVVPSEGESGKYYISKNHALISIKITPKIGYQMSPLTDRETDEPLVPVVSGEYEKTLSKDAHYYIVGTPKTYKIQEVAAPGMAHQETFGTVEYQYDSEDKIALPIPSYAGYVFSGWRITDGASVDFKLNTITGGEVIFPTSSFPASGDTLYAEPIWEGTPQTVTRYDCEFGTDNTPVNFENKGVQNTTEWQEKNGTTGITGLHGNDKDADLNESGAVKATFDEGGYKMYVGYYPFFTYADNSDYYSTLLKVKDDHEANKVYRYYTPITYTLVYEGLVDDTAYPKTHVYNVATSLEDLQPEKVGYTFAGWKVYIMRDGEKLDVTTQINSEVTAIKKLTLKAREMCLADGNTDETIVIEATWTPNVYNVTYAWNCDDEVVFDADKYNKIVFDSVLEITELPVRVGYRFDGWILTDAEGNSTEISVEDGKTLVNGAYASDITLTAKWTAKSFVVTLDGNGADSTDHTATLNVTFDAALLLPDGFKLPTRVGYTFVGYYLVTADGTELSIAVEDDGTGLLIPESKIAQWKIDGDTTLVAKWNINSYNVEVDIDEENASFTITDEDGNGRYDYNEMITVNVTVRNNHKLVLWCGSSIEHQTDFTYSFRLGAEDCVLVGIVLPIIQAPSFEVDYLKEVITTELSLIPDGRYRIVCDGVEPLELVVRNGKITVNGGDAQDVFKLPEAFYGKTIQIMTYGVPEVSADSDWYALTVNSRPAMPEANTPSAEIGGIYQQDDTKMVIEMTNIDQLHRFEFACSENSDGSDLTWWNVANADERYFIVTEDGKVMFVNLKPGTTYYVYVRVKAVDEDHAHGVANRIEKDTYSDSTLEAKKNALLALMKDTDGEMVKILIEQAIRDANGLVSPSPTFYNDLEAIYARVLASIEFARIQDAKIAELKAMQERMIASGEFSINNVNLINNICEVSVQTIKGAIAIDAVQIAYESAVLQLKEIPVTHLVYGDMDLTAKDGLEQGTALFQDRLTNINDITDAVNAAIQSEKFVYGGTRLTQVEIAEMIKTLDVMAAYQMRLTDAANVTRSPNGTFEIRLLLPAELRNVTGLQVAFYNDKTGEIEILDTERDGNCLVFYATHIEDFVIMGDPTMNLTGFIVALGLILACQLVGVILLLVRRAKYAKNVYHSVAVLPTVLLTIRFLPQNGVMLLTLLGGLVVVFQIILIYLLLTSEIVYRRKGDVVHGETREVEKDLPVMSQSYEEEIPAEEGVEYLAEEIVDEQETSEDYEDFIEPAANPRYSLPDDEFEEGALDVFSDVEDDTNDAESFTEEMDETYDEYAITPEDEVLETSAWEYGDEEDDAESDGALITEDAEWIEEDADWQYDDAPAEDDLDAEQTFETDDYDTEAYAESEYEDDAEAVFAEDDEYTEDAYVDDEYAYDEDAESFDEDAGEVYEDERYDEDYEDLPAEDSEEVYDDVDAEDEEPKQYDGYEE